MLPSSVPSTMASTPKPSPCFTPVNVFEDEGVKNGQKKRKLQMVLGSDGRDPPFIQLTSTDDTDGGSSASEVSVTRSPSRRGGAAVIANTRVCVACLCVCCVLMCVFTCLTTPIPSMYLAFPYFTVRNTPEIPKVQKGSFQRHGMKGDFQ